MAARAHPISKTGYAPEFVAVVLDDALTHHSRICPDIDEEPDDAIHGRIARESNTHAFDSAEPSSAQYRTRRIEKRQDSPCSTICYGIVGLQGTGKSTLSTQVAALAKTRGLSVVVLSIDDFYLDRRERLKLGHAVHPLLATRGPPGTHDVALACKTIDSLKEGRPTALPHFDKIADRRLPPSRWPLVKRRTDLIILEGWFLKVPPENPPALRDSLNALERDADPTGVWRAYCNHALATYAPLWQRIDRLLFLQGPGFEVVPDWRWQQEVTLQAAHPRRNAMDRKMVERFVLFFERVSRQALRTLPAIADRTIRIDALRQPVAP